MILFLKTDSPYCELLLQKEDGTRRDGSWHADRQLAKELLTRIEALLQSEQATWQDVTGLVIFRGPGSFTGLRIGATVFNTIAYSQTIPVVGSLGENWQVDGERRLRAGENDKIIVPEYGREARITQPKK